MTTTTTSSSRQLVERYYALIDGGELSEAADLMTGDVRLTFANAEPVQGSAAAEASIQYVLDQTSEIKHELLHLWEWDNGDDTRTVVFEIRITYWLKSGEVLSIPGAVVTTVNSDNKFTEQRLYGDLNEVFAG